MIKDNSLIRIMARKDLPAVFDIEYENFENPWSEEEFIESFTIRNYMRKVSECNEIVNGFMIYGVYDDMFDIFNFAVHPDYKRKGVGSKMLNHIKNKLSSSGRNKISLIVRERNLLAQLFFRKNGFKAIGIIRNFTMILEKMHI